ncbi:MAG: peptide ABC transporter substrate-binding protein [Clostridia bacterium]|nr:peptide ABC transporter substrate-binding protein [Clostridia bacterium]
MKKIIAVLLVVFMAAAVFSSCSKKSTGMSVCLASEPDTIDPALNSAVDGATLIAHLFQGLSKWAQDKDGGLVIVADAAKELVAPVENADGTVTYTYTLRDGLKWSDGKEVKASDFVYAWNRAASFDLGADYGYMFEVVKGYDAMTEAKDSGEKDKDGEPIYVAANPDAKLDAVADDAAKTITVTLSSPVSYWNELLAFPTYFPVREDVVKDEAWATEAATYVCNGPYTISKWNHDSVIVLEKNANFVDADQIKMDVINFYLSDDANNMLANFKNGSWQLIDDVPTNEMATLKKDYPNEYVVAGQIGTYYVCWNINFEILPEGKITGDKVADEKARQEIRNALSLVFDRNYIVKEIGQADQVPASSFVAMGMTEADGKTEFYKNANKAAGNSYVGYYNVDASAMESNVAAAKAVLDKYYTKGDDGKYTDFPALEYLYNTSEGHKAIGEYLAAALDKLGIKMNLTNQEWNTFLNTRKNGDYGIARNGWLADYNDPICFLDMWTTGSGNNDVQFGKGASADLKMYNLDLTAYGYDVKVENGTWAETYDVLISRIKGCTDNAKRMQMMHVAEDMLMATGCIVPLYYYTDVYMIDDSVSGFFSNPLGYKYFMYCTIK